MNAALVLMALLAPTAAPRRVAMAPSLPPLTREEEDKLDDIVRRFTQADIGALRGEAGRRAAKEFDALGREAVPALLRGLNRVASLKHSCPVLMISKKLNRLLAGSQDPVLLEFARDELQAGAKQAPHGGTLQDLRVRLMLRRNSLERFPPPAAEWYEKIPLEGLVRLARAERGARRTAALKQLARRDGREALLALARFGKPATGLLEANLARQSMSAVREAMGDKQPDLRKAAIRIAAAKDAELVWNILDRLGDDRADVRAEARAALKKMAGGEDFGPAARASKGEQDEAKRKWRAWWEKRYAEMK